LTTGKIRWKHQWVSMAHSMFVYRVDTHTYLANSWANLARKNDWYFNKYDINLSELIENKYARWLCSLIF
jgi:hypothetical protein